MLKFVILRNGKNIISNIYFRNDFTAIAEDDIENKNNEIISSLFLKITSRNTLGSENYIDL